LGSIISSIRVWLWPLTKRDLTGWSLQKVRDSLIRLAAKMGKTRVQMRGMKGQLKEVIDSYLGYVFLGKNHPKIIVRKTLLLEEGIIERKGSTNITTHDSPRWIFQKTLVMTQPSGLVELVNTLNFKRIWRNKRLLKHFFT